MALTPYQRISYRFFGRFVRKSANKNDRLGISLQKSRINVIPEVYLSYALMSSVISFAISFLLAVIIAAFFMTGRFQVGSMTWILLVMMPFFVAAATHAFMKIKPDMKARGRAKDIDAKLPYALNYISAMAAAGTNPDVIFDTLSRQKTYGQVAEESAWIHRDMAILGKDILTTINTAITRTPSIKFQDFLQGAATTISSGGDLKDYFMAKSEQFMLDNRQAQESFLETLGILAESFVTVAVAAPIFLLIMVSVLPLLSGGGSPFTLAYLIIFIMLPVSHGVFALAIKWISPEV
ncbi:MAG: hypothetical protein CVT48_02135 [Thermoplasmata archaeon HGW-Thermoplasmata-1]|nr:MAG: hypothetical protein CVT48_02135 [Thermoplasmata archaeon HGW-Thermoplasmata-1]